jgi:hypothetical protein
MTCVYVAEGGLRMSDGEQDQPGEEEEEPDLAKPDEPDPADLSEGQGSNRSQGLKTKEDAEGPAEKR